MHTDTGSLCSRSERRRNRCLSLAKTASTRSWRPARIPPRSGTTLFTCSRTIATPKREIFSTGSAASSTPWAALLNARLAKHPAELDLLNQSAFEAESRADFAGARKTLRLVLDSGKATSNDYNGFAWLALFDNHLDSESIQAGQQANLLSKNSSFADLHTLACLYAAQGKTTEARQLLLYSMAAGNQAEPNSAVWFVFGSIYEQLGENDATISAYRRVTAPDGTVNPIDTYNLAQASLRRLHSS